MKNILVPVDFSAASENAAVYAAHLAKGLDAEIHLLHVFHIPNPLANLPIELVITLDELKSSSDSELKKMAQEVHRRTGLESHRIHVASRNSSTKEGIIDHAAYMHAELLVMGMKKATIAKEYLVGSSVISVMRSITQPLIVVPEHAEFHNPRHLLLAVDSEGIHDGEGIQTLKQLMHSWNADLEIVHLLDSEDTDDRTEIILRSEGVLSGLKHAYSFPISTTVAESIQSISYEYKADLVVVSRNRHMWLSRMAGKDHTTKLAYHSETPILVLND